MPSIRTPSETWGWRDTAAVAALVAGPVLASMWVEPGLRDLEITAGPQDLFVYPAVFAAGLVFYMCWRMSRNPTTGWLAAGVTLVAVQGLGLAMVRVELLTGRHPSDLLVSADLLVALLLVATLLRARRGSLDVDPLAIGLAAGLLVTVLRIALVQASLPDVPEWSVNTVFGAVIAGHLALITLLLQLPRLPAWVAMQIGAAIVCLSVRRIFTFPVPESTAASAAALALGLLGAVILCCTALALLRIKLAGHRETVDLLHDRVEHLEADVRTDRERMHEISSTVAGIASASHLLHHVRLPRHRRDSMQRMLDSELARLQRLMDERQPPRMQEIDLDAVLEPLVVRQLARGRVVRWAPSGARAHGRPDDLAEAMSILLENAAVHGGGHVQVSTRLRGDSVAIQVSDAGPGIPPALHDRLFDWGARGRSSTGQGIGLHIAHRLVTEQRGSLRLEDRPGPGATFVVTLEPVPAEES